MRTELFVIADELLCRNWRSRIQVNRLNESSHVSSPFLEVMFSIRWLRIWIWPSIISYTEGMMLSCYTFDIISWHSRDVLLPEQIRGVVYYSVMKPYTCWSNKSSKLRLLWRFRVVMFRLWGLHLVVFCAMVGWLAFEALG